MLTIKENIKNEIIIKKSKFITFLIKINNKKEIKEIINELKEKYKGATHYCYAYIINNEIGYTDDKEPNKTAGKPILNCLEKNNLNYIMCVVIRYFGGIKLGANGLIRAYSNSCKEVINLSEIIELKNGKNILIEFSYDNTKIIDKLLKEIKIIDKEYNKNVKYTFNISNNDLNKIKKELIKNTINYRELNDILF